MKLYPHHIGDFDRATRHLSRIERSIYRDLIELYYDTEERLTLDKAVLCRKIIARSNEEATAVEQTLNEFFTETPTGWYHDRCETEIARYRANNSQKAQAGRASAQAKAEKRQQALNARSTDVEVTLNGTPTNHKPITINHKPILRDDSSNPPPTREAAICVVVKAMGIGSTNPDHPKLAALLADGATVSDFEAGARIAVENQKGFAYLLGVVEGMRNDARRPSKPPANGSAGETFKERDARLAAERMAEFAPGVARKAPLQAVNSRLDSIDVEVRNVAAIASH